MRLDSYQGDRPTLEAIFAREKKMYLENAEERNKLRRVGFNGKEIEHLFILLNDFVLLKVNRLQEEVNAP